MTRGVVDGPCSEVSPILIFSPASDALTRMPEVCISFVMDLNTVTYGGVHIHDVVEIMESVNIVEERGPESVGSEV